MDVFCQPDVRLLRRVQEVDGVRDVRRVESLLHQPHLLHLEGSRHLQAGLQNTQSELKKQTHKKEERHNSAVFSYEKSPSSISPLLFLLFFFTLFRKGAIKHTRDLEISLL